ncbi:30S ribosomal protein S3 [Texas Phoenix palm phytoplasma]|uniref:Small ribosomal subunit protein uS3 n=5 Tax=16SrIV (Coconut lethal yellows group) TaxID=3048141 RepID=B7TYL7_9MOLU|nr:30S ribosomal protein S3 [Texas Phoenix palm phytoplasma]ABC49685.1 ribosomal protein S3 [Coyol palm decline phytoplasma]ABC49688.1 ribosomal protein S3 [Coconut decline phytoplasma]ABC49693.1 ribosomal protein S3 [Carludovica palmata leaf yellowing phytoplasma]ACJ45991.1 ribosomal protein S3 [Florida sabal palm phytoplasma]ABK51375.1 ribosomal protein S3 [Texas Phoenix palm phytoplasma]
MGQKSNPIGLRLGINKNWESQWYAEYKQVPFFVIEDFRIRKLINNFYTKGIISKIVIKRLKKSNIDNIEIDLYTSKIGLVQSAEKKEKNVLIKKLEQLIKKKFNVNFFEVKSSEKIAILVAQNIALQLEKRAFFRSVQKIFSKRVLKSGAEGVKITISGRLGGAEIARRESISLGLVPLNTFKCDIDYGFSEAHTTFGVLGVQVLINNGIKKTPTLKINNNIKQTDLENKN